VREKKEDNGKFENLGYRVCKTVLRLFTAIIEMIFTAT
jgi:hypothetical protein